MRAVLVFALALLAAGSAPAQDRPPAAGPDAPPAPRSAARAPSPGTPLKPVEEPGAREKRLDALFDQLRREASPAKADRIADRINAEWFDSGSATVNLLMRRAREAITREDKVAAFDFLDQAIVLDPNYAEGWNLRATLNYTSSNYSQSLDDIRATLRREPRHFGALSGLGAILEETGRKPEALRAYMKVLEIYPALRTAQEAVGRLSDELAGQAL